MGRRARCNCSPVDSVLEKYHSDIGNRLSGIFLPPTQQDASDTFSMLTLNFRRSNSVKATKTQPTTDTTSAFPTKDDTDKSRLEESFPDHHSNDSAFANSSTKRCNTLPSMNSHQGFPAGKEKRNIMDKLARVIFQRKHTCARCQRRSKSCLQNKSFNVNEKHHMCSSCREANQAIKSIVSGKDHTTDAEGNTAKNSADIVLPKPRVQLKDSGYETVTSCSTVASAHSNSNSPYASSNKSHDKPSSNNNSKTSPALARLGVGDKGAVSTKDNSDTPCPDCHSSGHDDEAPRSNTNVLHPVLQQFLGGAGEDGVRKLQQVKTRYVQNYDGYLPDQQTFPHPCDLFALTDHTPLREGTDQNDSANDSDEDTATAGSASNNTSKPAGRKSCHICSTSSRPCFRLPWEGGWLCEECIDGML